MSKGESVSVAAKTGMIVLMDQMLSEKEKNIWSKVLVNTLCLKLAATPKGTLSSGRMCSTRSKSLVNTFMMAVPKMRVFGGGL